MPYRLSLHSGWTLRHVGDASDAPVHLRGLRVPATVPGCVHTDLLAQDLIEDPYIDDAETRLTWIGHTAWEYACAVEWRQSGHERVELVCEGLDTVAEVSLNGRHLASTRNMHRTYRIDVTDAIRPGGNDLAVRFDSAYAYAEDLERTLGARPHAYPEAFNFIRKMACNFGWDWGPTLVTAGIWRPISVHAWSTARLAEVRPVTSLEDGRGVVTVRATLERTRTGSRVPVTVSLRVAGSRVSAVVPAGEDSVELVAEVEDPQVWWPHGMGEQPLYDCEVRLLREDGDELDVWHTRLGFRSFHLDTSGDESRSAFTFVVNDVPIFARGVNWIPDDCFPSRVDRRRYRERLEQAVELGVNVVRVWGGGLYESDDFYELCDELGLLVWQDFLFACAAYPEEEPLRSEVEAEARENVARLTPHPSLVLWCGNNENIWGYDVWDWEGPLEGRTWGEGYYYDLLARVVAETDPSRPYWAGSPWSGSPERDPNDVDHGCVHIWDVWNGSDYLAYRDRVPPFVSEFGWQAPPTWATLRRAVHDDPLEPGSPMMLHHQKAAGGQANLDRGLAWHFTTPVDVDDWHYLTQLNQARALQVGIEHWLASWPRTAGAIIWQLNDCWPVASWALVDGDGRRKPSWYAVRRTFADRVVTVQSRDEGPAAVLVNHRADAWQARLTRQLVDAHDGVERVVTTDVTVPAHSVTSVPFGPEFTPSQPRRQFLVADTDAGRGLWFFVEDHEFDHPTALPEVHVDRAEQGYAVTVRAHALLRDLLLQADRLAPDAVVDDALVTLVPGESVVFTVRTRAELEPVDLGAHPVLNWVGSTQRRARTDAGTAADELVSLPSAVGLEAPSR